MWFEKKQPARLLPVLRRVGHWLALVVVFTVNKSVNGPCPADRRQP